MLPHSLSGRVSMFNRAVLIRGGGDLGSGVALRLWRSGFPVMILETKSPICVRRSVSFAEAVHEGSWRVEEAEARHVYSAYEAIRVLESRTIPVLVDPNGDSIEAVGPAVVVDAIMAKRNLGTTRDMAGTVIGLGPGFVAGGDVDAVVETNRGPHLGRVLWDGAAQPNTGLPGPVGGKSSQRVLRAPDAGVITVAADIGAIVEMGTVLATVGEHAVEAPFTGLVRGMIRNGTVVVPGMKIGDIDPRLVPELCALVSDKALAIAGGVLEAIMYFPWRRQR